MKIDICLRILVPHFPCKTWALMNLPFQMSGPSQHKYRYKNQGLDSAEMRRRREEEGVQLRKQKREQQLAKRRNVNDLTAGLGEDETVEASMNQASGVWGSVLLGSGLGGR